MVDPGVTVEPTFRVWLRPLGTLCRIRVEGIDKARWLLDRLKQAFNPDEPSIAIRENDNGFCTFNIASGQLRGNSETSRDMESLLRSLPQVRLMDAPE